MISLYMHSPLKRTILNPLFFLPHLLFVISREWVFPLRVFFFFLSGKWSCAHGSIPQVLVLHLSVAINWIFAQCLCITFQKDVWIYPKFFCFISFTETGIFWHFLNTISCKDVRLDQWYTAWKGFSGSLWWYNKCIVGFSFFFLNLLVKKNRFRFILDMFEARL